MIDLFRRDKFKGEKKKKSKIFFYSLMLILTFLMVHFYFSFGEMLEDTLENEIIILIEIGISLFVVLVFILLEKFGIIKGKTDEEKEKERLEKEKFNEEKKKIDDISLNSLRKRITKQNELLNYMEKRMNREGEDGGNKWIWNWVSFGLVVFFVAFLFFGSLDGRGFNRDKYVADVENALRVGGEALKNAIDILFDSFKDLIIKFYDIGASNPELFYYLWIITLIWWMGYMFIYKIFKANYQFIKDIMDFFKGKKNKKKIKIDDAVHLIGDVGEVIT